MTTDHRLEGVRVYGRASEAFDTVAWRTPTAARFDARVANDPVAAEPTLAELVADLPGWVTIVAGGAVAALIGAMLGGALAV